ncbi:ADP-ribose glycohydrolase MACROD1 isoform X2 [Corythoichthys intestinalis]|uniref:ADP-ribose glycohydrolase MACROD1 isoform X2 n=1 Tax=Corythoichthys intestinalis TaxID=161448 RepID=UPI0025A611D2|nr:ADP-ribose glycohydrolase MACROD1 isoform X2 [Corythoichthys intestinalis]
MAIQISRLFSRLGISMLLSAGPVSLVATGVRFKHIILTLGSAQVGRKPVPSPLCGHINTANLTATTATRSRSTRGNCFSPPLEKRLRSASGIGALTKFLHTGAMAAIKVDLNSREGDWKDIKEFLLSQPVEGRRKYYRTEYIQLDNIPIWTHTGASDFLEVSYYLRNQNLDGKISVYSGDITVLEVDAIVNAANQTLLGGGGDVIHTVGPIVQSVVGEAERSALRSCYENSLRKATENNARSVAFPCISTGIYGYPPEQAVHEALATVREFLEEHHDKFDRVIFCVFLPNDLELYLQNIPLYFPVAC